MNQRGGDAGGQERLNRDIKWGSRCRHSTGRARPSSEENQDNWSAAEEGQSNSKGQNGLQETGLKTEKLVMGLESRSRRKK